MRVVLSFVAVLAFLSALAVILLYMTGHTGRRDGLDVLAGFVGSVIVGVITVDRAIDLGKPRS
ncbi:MAG: hypothetical protein QY323_03450 [Patescibacteria group bacterium]|nr:MAG: hypothetical protein QY323_03450 [Patescibacteria group bacterium]